MSWLKEILLALVQKIKGWEAFTLLLIGLVGYFGIQFYEKQTQRIMALAEKPKAVQVNWVSNKSTEAGVGIIKDNSEENSQIKGAK